MLSNSWYVWCVYFPRRMDNDKNRRAQQAAKHSPSGFTADTLVRVVACRCILMVGTFLLYFTRPLFLSHKFSSPPSFLCFPHESVGLVEETKHNHHGRFPAYLNTARRRRATIIVSFLASKAVGISIHNFLPYASFLDENERDAFLQDAHQHEAPLRHIIQ